MQLEIAISTLNHGLYKCKFEKGVQYLIVHQISDGEEDAYKRYIEQECQHIQIRYLQSNSIGISKSRNIALANAGADYVWLMDDDVTLNLNSLKAIENILITDSPEVLTVRHLQHNHKNGEAENTALFRHNHMTAMSVSSIDLIISKAALNAELRFDERFGLGAEFISGEEFIFLSDAIRQNKNGVLGCEILASTHTSVSSGHRFYKSDIGITSKFAMFDRVFRSFSWIMALLFIGKKAPLLLKNCRLFRAFMLYVRFYVLRRE